MDDSELPYNFRSKIASSFLFGIAETPTDEKKTQKIRQMSWLRSGKKKENEREDVYPTKKEMWFPN